MSAFQTDASDQRTNFANR